MDTKIATGVLPKTIQRLLWLAGMGLVLAANGFVFGSKLGNGFIPDLQIVEAVCFHFTVEHQVNQSPFDLNLQWVTLPGKEMAQTPVIPQSPFNKLPGFLTVHTFIALTFTICLIKSERVAKFRLACPMDIPCPPPERATI